MGQKTTIVGHQQIMEENAAFNKYRAIKASVDFPRGQGNQVIWNEVIKLILKKGKPTRTQLKTSAWKLFIRNYSTQNRNGYMYWR